MKKKKKLYDNYEELLLNCYGVPRGSSRNRELVLSKSFDNGEILIQQVFPKESFREYVVQSSVTEVPFEEYIVTEVQPGQEVSTDSNESSNGTYAKNDKSLDDTAKLALLDKIGEQEKSSIPDTTVDQPPARSQSFETTRSDKQNQRNDDDFVSDIEAILKGKKIYDPEKKIVRKTDVSSPYSAQQTRAEEKPLPPLENKHAIFDQIKQSMEFAKAYDLGSVDLEKRFSDFDKIYELQKSTPAEKKMPEKSTPTKEPGVSNEEFLRDLDEIARLNETSNEKVTSAPVEKINGDIGEIPGQEEYVIQSSIPISYSKSVTGIVSNGVITDAFYRDAEEKKKLTNRSGGRTQHLGIDVSLSNASGEGINDPRRGLPVHAAIKTSIPITDLNSVRTANGTGMGLKGNGNADLINAVVLAQPWSDGGNAYGGVLGLACRFGYTDDKSSRQTLTLYIEFLHLITTKFPPKDGSGKIIPVQDWTAAHPGQIDFGPSMTNDAILQPSAFDPANLPLVGYLGATEFPHVHVQVAFASGEHKYLKSVRFDPEVMIS